MFTIHIKGEHNPIDVELVKLTLIFYKSGYNRVPKVLYVTGPYNAWDQTKESFIGRSSELTDKNRLLQHERLRYLKVAEKWEASSRNWTPRELAHYYDEQPRSRERYLSVSEMIDRIILRLESQERSKNGRIFTSLGTAEKYFYLKKSLERFTRSKYRRDFSKFLFRDIDEKFLQEYVVHEKQRGARNGNNGGVREKLRGLRAVCAKAKDERIYGVNLNLFHSVKNKIKPEYSSPKAVSHLVIRQIEEVDRSLLNKREALYIDLFLFSYYACGMSPIDICFLEHSRIKNGMIVYERIKLDRTARVILTDKASELIEKYRDEGYMNFVFPIIKKRKMTQVQQYSRVDRIITRVNKTLLKICTHLNIREHITWSCARASFISRMVDEGYHPMQIAEQAGNSPMTIYKHYYTITNKEEMRKSMNEVFGKTIK